MLATHRILLLTAAAFCALVLFFSGPAFAQSPFYQGKTITLIVGSAPGGTGDLRIKATLRRSILSMAQRMSPK